MVNASAGSTTPFDPASNGSLRCRQRILMNLTSDPNLHPLCHPSHIFKPTGLTLPSAAKLSHDHRREGFEEKLFAFVSVFFFIYLRRNIVTQGMPHSTVHGQSSRKISKMSVAGPAALVRLVSSLVAPGRAMHTSDVLRLEVPFIRSPSPVAARCQQLKAKPSRARRRPQRTKMQHLACTERGAEQRNEKKNDMTCLTCRLKSSKI